MIKVTVNGKRKRLKRKGEPISLEQELKALRREEGDRLAAAENAFFKVDRVCIAFERSRNAR